jgi:hypothetical protein
MLRAMKRLLLASSLLTCATATAFVSACDTEFLNGPRPDIDDGRTIDDGSEGEGEGEAPGEGEGEGEPVGPGAVCNGARDVVVSDAIATNTTRARHAAVLLRDGRVLIAGGHDEATYLSMKGAELFDPATRSFDVTGAMAQARYDFALVALDDGRALAVGGFNNDVDTPDDNGDLATLELFDPATGTWTAGPSMPEARSGLSAVKVEDGRVLIFGGKTNAESIPTTVLSFDPSDDSLSSTDGEVSFGRTSHTAHLLSDGRVLMVGGYYTGLRDDVDVIAADGSVSPANRIPEARRSSCAANDADGRLLVFGGYGGASMAGSMGDVQAFSPSDGTWASAGEMQTARFACEAVELSCGTLVCGGVDATSCELRDHASERTAVVVDDTGGEFSGSLTALDDERALWVGGFVGDGVSGTARVIELVAAE